MNKTLKLVNVVIKIIIIDTGVVPVSLDYFIGLSETTSPDL